MDTNPNYAAVRLYIEAGHFADADAAIAQIKAEREQGKPTYIGPLKKSWFVNVIEQVGARQPPLHPPRPMSDLDRRRAGLPAANFPPMIDLAAVHCGWGR